MDWRTFVLVTTVASSLALATACESPPPERHAATSGKKVDADKRHTDDEDSDLDATKADEDAEPASKPGKKKPHKDVSDEDLDALNTSALDDELAHKPAKIELDEAVPDTDESPGTLAVTGEGDAKEAAGLYPHHRFNGTGFSTCDGRKVGVTSNVEARFVDGNFVQTKGNTFFHCKDGDRCEDIDRPEQLAQYNQTNTYPRLPPDELKQLRKDGYPLPPFTGFSKAVQSQGGISYTFDKPLPVVPWVGSTTTRYEALNQGPMSWQAHATNGQWNLTVNMKVTKLAEQDGVVTLEYEMRFSEQVDANFYKQFPIPHKAVYVIDTKLRAVTAMNIVSIFNGEASNDRCNSLETSQMQMRVCDRILGGKTQNFGCQYGQNQAQHFDI